jgi:predicted nucleotidyltransferase
MKNSAQKLAGFRYPAPDVPVSAIRQFARSIGARFKPDRIYLFGSYAYGQPHEESDVDLLVIMRTTDTFRQAGADEA